MSCTSPIVRTQFLGASISSYNASIGLNGQQGSIDIIVVQDECNGGGLAYSDNGSGGSHIATSDAFNPPELGTPVTFRFGAFEFGGLLQNWRENDSAEGAKTYSIRLVDPQQIVEGTQLILSSYIGETLDMPNLYNIYGWLEHNLGSACGEMLTFGTYPPFGFNIILNYDIGTGFGGVEDRGGVPWWHIRYALSYLLNQQGDIFGSKLSYRGVNYNFDLTELPLLINEVRFSEDYMSLGDLISEICSLASCDYFYELINNDTIKVRVINRKDQENDNSAWDIDTSVGTPINSRLNLGTINSSIGGTSVIDKDRGIELRDAYTNAFLTGEFRQDIWQIDWNTTTYPSDANIWPYWGRDKDGLAIPSYGIDDNDFIGDHYFDVETSTWGIPGLNALWRVTGTELRFALAGETQWRNYIATIQPNLVNTLHFAVENFLPNIGTFYYTAVAAGLMLPRDLVAARQADAIAAGKENDTWQRVEQIYDNILQYAQTFFGRKFLIKLPYLCIRSGNEAPYTIETNWTIARDGGWYEGSVLGLLPGSPYLEHFRQDDGKIIGFVGFESNKPLDLSALNNRDDYIQVNPYTAYVKCQVDDIIQVFPGDWRAVISLPGPVYNFMPDPEVAIILGLWAMARKKYGGALTKKIFKVIADRIGSDKVKYDITPLPLIPTKAAIPLQSRRLVYGPWAATVGDLKNETTSSAGKTNYQRNPDFAPWNFNGFDNMNLAGDAWVYGQLSTHYVTEQGSISVPSSPTMNLGDKLYSDGPVVTNVNINIQGGNSPLTTNYTMRTYTPSYGKVAGQYINSIKRAAQWSRQSQRLFRLWALDKFRTSFDNVYGYWQYNVGRAIRYTTSSSHDLIAGENIQDAGTTGGYRSSVAFTELRKHLPELHKDDYSNKACMDVNGLFRPFSTKYIAGSGVLSTFENSGISYTSSDLDNITQFYPKEQVPPVNNEPHLPIIVETLNPFLSSDDVNTYLLGTSKGHDIEYIARDGVYPTNLSVRQPSDNYSSTNWYRGIALKGPLIIVGPGYDIDNKPVPNAATTYPNGAKLQFKTNWLRRPQDWKCGPLDVRWDYNRKVWTCPSPMKLVHIKLLETLLPIEQNEASAYLYGEQRQVDETGNYIAVQDEISVSCNTYTILTAGMNAVAYYDTYKEKYYAIAPNTPIPFKAASYHPGSDTPFNIYLGTPSTSTDVINYGSDVYTAIDFRQNTPTPTYINPTGEGICTPSDLHGGWYLRVIDMDC